MRIGTRFLSGNKALVMAALGLFALLVLQLSFLGTAHAQGHDAVRETRDSRYGRESREPRSNAPINLATVLLSDLPAEAQFTYQRILVGGPFPYDKDGTVFGNRERALPAKGRGYYREYTVRTPWVKHRGARRIVCGGQRTLTPDACFYTDDHYSTFRHILTTTAP